MPNRTKRLLASTALMVCLLHAAPSFSDTITRQTVTETPNGTTTQKTVTETAPAASVHTTVTESSDGTTVKKTVTETVSDPASTPSVATTSQTSSVRTETSWANVDKATGAHIINFMDFDLNTDGILSVNEIGKSLFKLYDADDNNVIDNIEYDRRALVTVMPVEKSTVVTYDFDGDGRPDETKYTYETFMKNTQLTRFDKNGDGLSPREFTDLSFLIADVNDDKVIDLKEWQGSYIAGIDKANKDKARFN